VFTGATDAISNNKIIKDFRVLLSLYEFGQANALWILLGSFGRVAGFERVVYRSGRLALQVCLFGEI
jgi:hypothetical protein